jgi:DNA-binding NarL/FixJ family response regulator
MSVWSKNIKIVIVEDDPIFSAVLVKCLRKHGWKNIEVFNSAIPLLNREDWNPDLILMDFKMSDLNGARAARSIKRKMSDTVIVLMSSSKRINRVKRQKFKIDGIVQKDLGIEKIVKTAVRIYKVKRLKQMIIRSLIWLFLLAVLSTILYQFL